MQFSYKNVDAYDCLMRFFLIVDRYGQAENTIALCVAGCFWPCTGEQSYTDSRKPTVVTMKLNFTAVNDSPYYPQSAIRGGTYNQLIKHHLGQQYRKLPCLVFGHCVCRNLQ